MARSKDVRLVRHRPGCPRGGAGVPRAGSRERAPGRGRRPRAQLEAVGAVPGRAAVGHRARGLLARRRPPGTTSRTTTPAAAPTAGARTACSGISDRECRLCFALALWNGRDPILKERLFGLTGPEGNHGEDVKELYYYLDSTPTHSYCKALYKYPQAEFPYDELVAENRRRGRAEPRVRAGRHRRLRRRPLLRRVRRVRQGRPRRRPDPHHRRQPRPRRGAAAPAADAVVPQHLVLGLPGRGLRRQARDSAALDADGAIAAGHADAGRASCCGPERRPTPAGCSPRTRPTTSACSACRTQSPYVKDAFHDYVVHGREDRVNPAGTRHQGGGALPAGDPRRRPDGDPAAPDQPRRAPARSRTATSTRCFAVRRQEADEFYAGPFPALCDPAARTIVASSARATPGCCGRSSSTTTSSRDWLEGDPAQPAPPAERRDRARNADWPHLYNRDVISMPDKWEYPWYAAWDLAFHMIPFARIDPEFAKEQLLLLLREWYMHPNGQLPAYEFALRRREPAGARLGLLAGLQDRRRPGRAARPAISWPGCSRSCCSTSPGGSTARTPTAGTSSPAASSGWTTSACSTARKPLPTGGHLEQADGTAWMAFYCATMLSMALELARQRPGLRGHRLQVLRALRRHRRRHEHPGRHRPVGRGGRLLLRPAARRRPGRCRCGCARWSA